MSAHVQLLHGLDFPPASRIPDGCSRCHASRRPMAGEPDGKEPIIDLGINIEFEGAVYLCFSCWTEIAKLVIDSYPDTRVEELHAARRRDGSVIRGLRLEAEALAEAYQAQGQQIEAMRGEINALRKK